MKSIKLLLSALLCCALVMGVAPDVQAQTKGKKKTAKTTKTTKKKKAPEPAAPVKTDVELPYNSNDCLFAIELQPDRPFGPTSAPDGGGRMQEVVADKAHPNLFEREHNTVWYKVKIPYNGKLEISIAQKNQWDDYDFMVYRNTGVYFSNQVIQNKVLPVAVNLGQVDSNALAAATLKANEAKPRQAAAKGEAKPKKAETEEPVFTADPVERPTIGMTVDAKDKMLTKKQKGGFIQSIPVHMGEEYYIVLDNVSANGQGHTITVSVHADAYEPLVLFYDRKAKRYVDVDLMILEKGGSEGERILKELRLRSGMTALTGPGVVVTIDDSKIQSKAGENQNLYIIHDDDLLKVINELRAAGAEAISVNGQRLMATSEIRCAGPTLSVNNVRSAPPYEIRAIGDSATLESALRRRGGVMETLQVWGIQLEVKAAQDIVVPAYKGASKFSFAKEAEEAAS